jgi:hypothetical protein
VPTIAVQNATVHKMRPDYFFASVDPGGTTEVWAVECKGSHSSRLWPSQLRTAASQVANVFVDGSPPPALLFAAHLQRDAITVRILDPPSDKWRGPYVSDPTVEPPFSLLNGLRNINLAGSSSA